MSNKRNIKKKVMPYSSNSLSEPKARPSRWPNLSYNPNRFRTPYKRLLVYKLAEAIYDLTPQFNERYLNRFSHNPDQVDQAARSGVQNIAEGHQQQGIKGYIKLTGVSRDSLPCRGNPLKVYLIMPRKNTIKTYVKHGHYHVYNRGVEKRVIFKDTQDYKVFLNYLEYSLSPPPKLRDIKKTFTLQGLPFKGVPRMPKTYHNKIDLLAYCLMPNHFHLLIKQGIEKDAMISFITSLATRYTMYFNKRYTRVGSLYQGPYKAKLINNDAYLLHLSRYIHTNPKKYFSDLTKAYSSYPDYLKLKSSKWVKPNKILKFFNKKTLPDFNKINSYKDFVKRYKQDSEKILGGLTLE